MEKREAFLTYLVSIFLTAVFPIVAQAQQLCSSVFGAARYTQDSAVELELNRSHAVLKILTTKDGTIRPILEEGKRPLPPKMVKLAKVRGLEDPMDLPWDSLRPELQIWLLQYVGKDRTAEDFFQDRRIPGLKIRETVELTFTESTQFLGKIWEPGTHLVEIGGVMGKVEYMSPGSAPLFNGVELHFRDNQAAGNVSRDAWILLQAAGINRPHQHVHMVAPLPLQALEANPEVQSASMGDFFKRSNLVAEFSSLKKGFGIRTNTGKVGRVRVIYFDSLNQDRLQGVTQYFVDISQGKNPKIGSNFKLGWVGMRGSDTYDSRQLWGLEFRDIMERDRPELVETILSPIQQSMLHQRWGIGPDVMQRWIQAQKARFPNQPVAKLVANSWYNKNLVELYRRLPKHLKGKIGWLLSLHLWFEIENMKEVKMLLHDWSTDPLYFESPDRLRQINELQIQAIQKMKKSPQNHAKIVSDFLVKSGIAKDYAETLGIDYHELLRFSDLR